MKNYKQILEAVNRGIQLALDDFDDEEPVQNIKSKQVQNRDYTKEYLDTIKQFVDLGLPSGNLWCKYNLGAPVSKMKNILHTERVDYIGGFYAWGEIEERFNNFTQQAYKFNYSEFNSKNLSLQNDAAYTSNNYPFKIYMPSYDDYNELKNNTTLDFKENYNGVEGLNGIIYKSNVNDNEIFIPNISYKQSDIGKIDVWSGSSFGCWTDTASWNNEKAYMIYCSKTIWYGGKITYSCNNVVVDKWCGAQIRPIIKKRG